MPLYFFLKSGMWNVVRRTPDKGALKYMGLSLNGETRATI
jgi:hypothetical protein